MTQDSAFRCCLIFERLEPIFYSGELIKGVIELESKMDLAKWIKSIRLHGTCKNEWQQAAKPWSLKRRKKRICTDGLFYANYYWFDQRDNIKLKKNSDGLIEKQQLKFHFQLLNQLPTSCITKYGQIRYELQFIMEEFRGSLQNKFKLEQPITIIRTLNPNRYQVYERSWYFELKPILRCKLNHACFVPGEQIHFELNLTNARFLYFIQSITIELQELQGYASLSNYRESNWKTARYTLDTYQIENVKFNREMLKNKRGNYQNFIGTLKIPLTTVPSSNYPIYRKYKVDPGIFHVITIKLKARPAYLPLFHRSGCSKLITIGTQRMLAKEHKVHGSQADTKMERAVFTCLPSEQKTVLNAFIPKFDLKCL